MPTITATPIAQTERIILLDSLRGIAVLGILFMNIPGFSDSMMAFRDPTLIDFTGSNYYLWFMDNWFLEGSQRALFSMLFGAGLLIFLSRLEKKENGMMSAEYFLRRQLWLLLFGLFNAYLLMWHWDILFCYAIVGIVLFVFRRLEAKHLLIAAALCLGLQVARENVDLYRDKGTISRGEAIAAMDTTKTKLAPILKDQLTAMQNLTQRSGKPAMKERRESDVRAVQHSYMTLYQVQSENSFRGQSRGMFHFLFFDALVFMFIGMAFFKTGIITGSKKAKTYLWMFLVGLGIGLPLSYLRLRPELATYQFDYVAHVKGSSFEFYGISRTLRAIGIFGGIMLLYKSGFFKWFFSLMRPVGQMAFTNYLMQSIMCGFIFYGIGLGYYGKMQRDETYLVVAGVWVVEIIWSHIWLRYFRFGPFEWAWRSLTYWKRQPFRKSKGAEIMEIRVLQTQEQPATVV